MECRSFTLAQQFTPKYKEPGNHNSGEDMLRTCTYSIQNNFIVIVDGHAYHNSIALSRVQSSFGN